MSLDNRLGLPAYIAESAPNPVSNRAAWYHNTAPSYAGIFLWIVFYQSIAEGSLNHAGPLFCILAVASAGVLSWVLFYYAPAMLGMKTGLPLYVVGSSTFGTVGGYFMPGLLMGVLQVGWFAVGTYYPTVFILRGLDRDPRPATLPFAIVAIAWGYTLGFVGVKGIKYVARVSTYLSIIPAVMLLFVFSKTAAGISKYVVPSTDHFLAFTTIVQAILGFFATAGAAGSDFGMNSRDARDVRLGGFVGIAVAATYAGALPLLSVAGAHGSVPGLSYGYDAIIESMGGFLSSSMFFLFAIASVTPACFVSFIAGNSFSTMIPRVTRMQSSMLGVTIAVILAVSGYAANLVVVFSIVGASFGPICGAMLADYLLTGKKWAGPRLGINWAGYAAWAVGFVIGILPLPFMPVSDAIKMYAQPATLYSLIAGFIVYVIVAKAGGQPQTVESAILTTLREEG
jgi:cytosine permease